MIARLIDWCVANRGMTVALAGALLALGIWAERTITVDAIPDLSDVQVIVRAPYPGQAPRIVEDQVTQPLATTLLATPGAEVVRGYSLFGLSLVYVIFEEGTDLYWARSRTLEQLSAAAARLPAGVAPELGPDATGVGWVYQYMLVTGAYCPDHPDGLWEDPATGSWFSDPDEAPEDARDRLVRHRAFLPSARTGVAGVERCPIDGKLLVQPDVDLAELRSMQDWRLRYALMAAPGVSEVASVGGFVKQYQIQVDPVKLLAQGLSLAQLKRAIQRANLDVGGGVVEQGEREFMVRGLGYLGELTDEEIEQAQRQGLSVEELRTQRAAQELGLIALKTNDAGAPVLLRDVAEITVGPRSRRGLAEWNGLGEAVGGVVVMRFGENARTTIERVKRILAEQESSLPPGVAILTGYDRSDLIDRAVETLNHALVEEIVIVSVVVLLFLAHARSALVAIASLPLGVLAALLVMRLLGASANIMSLGGLAISIGVMVDSAIIMVENAHKHIERERRLGGGALDHVALVVRSAREVGPSLFFALLIITVSFLPIFALTGESGRLFRPLALTKTLAMAAGALLAVTAIPAFMTLFVRESVVAAGRSLLLWLGLTLAPAAALALAPRSWLGDAAPLRWWIVLGWTLLALVLLLPQRVASEERNPLNRLLRALYEPFFALVMRFRVVAILLALLATVATVHPLRQLGSEFMPPLEEGDLLYMPTTDPGVSVAKARELLQQTNKLIMQFPEVRSAWGKVGRADTATDPAPLSMLETTIILERDKAKWRRVPVERFFDDWPAPLRRPLRAIFPATRPITVDELVYGYELPGGVRVPGLNDATTIPGLTNAWTMPIRTRLDMLSTGVKTPVGVKVMGEDLPTLARLAGEVAAALKADPRTAPYTASAFAEKTVGGTYLDVQPDREALARYGLSIQDALETVAAAVGGVEISSTVEGLARYPVQLRYPRELRDTPEALERVLVATPAGSQVPLGALAKITVRDGPPVIKSENAVLASWVYVDIRDIDMGSYVAKAQQVVRQRVQLPTGCTLAWTGQFERLQEAKARLAVVGPIAVGLIVALLYLATRSWLRVLLVLLALPFSLVGAVWLLYALDYRLSLAVWVGMIALAGLAAETGLVMLLYLDNSVERFRKEGRLRSADDLWWAIHDGAVQRIRPKTMTVAAILAGLAPLLWASGAGADTMRRLAVPMIGGVGTSFVMELLVFPPLYFLAQRIALARAAHRARDAEATA